MAEKQTAALTYKGERGYMPIVSHIAETGMVVHDEFRDGNISPNTENLEFIKKCCAKMPKGKKTARFRADSASYQGEIFNWCEHNNIKFAVGGRIDIPVKTIINKLDDSHWRPYKGSSSITCVPHCMKNTNRAFSLIIIRRPWQPDLLDPQADDSKRYVLVATNIDGKSESIVSWYNQRGEASENRIKELKIGFSMEYMPCGTVNANAVYFRIGVLAYNTRSKLFDRNSTTPPASLCSMLVSFGSRLKHPVIIFSRRLELESESSHQRQSDQNTQNN